MKTYITALSDKKYLKGCLVLNESLKQVNFQYPLVVLASKDFIKNHKFLNLNNQTINENDLQEIYDNYTISREKVKNIQKALLETFPYESDITVTEISN